MSDPAKAVIAGLYGKVPQSRDFLRRGLPNGFVTPWDDWLSRSLMASRDVLQEAWLPAYLTSPPWRFVLDQGLISQQRWIGVVASSVDEVHRCFPLTLALSVAISPLETSPPYGGAGRLASAIEALALRMIDGSCDADAASRELARLAQSAAVSLGTEESGTDSEKHLSSLSEIAAWKGPEAPLGEGGSIWWHDDWNGHPRVAFRCRGFPDPDIYTAFLDGQWNGRESIGNAVIPS